LHAINANKETRTDKQDLLAISVWKNGVRMF
jgi:hypothetical protein